MQWYLQIEIKMPTGWEDVERDSLAGDVEIDKSHSEASTFSFSVKNEYLQANWHLRQVRCTYHFTEIDQFDVLHNDSKLLFDGLVRRSTVDVIAQSTMFECVTMTKQLIAKSAATLKTLKDSVQWSSLVFGDIEKLTETEQFEKLLSASDYILSENGLELIDPLIKFQNPVGSAVLESAYDHYHTDYDIVASDATSLSVDGAITIAFSDPLLTAPVDTSPDQTLIPDDVYAPAPLNRIICKVTHRFKRLCQELFTYSYAGGNLKDDHVLKGAYMLMRPTLDAAVEGLGLRQISGSISYPAIGSTNLGTSADPLYYIVSQADGQALVQSFNLTLGRRYIVDCEYVYTREVCCRNSEQRYGSTIEEISVDVVDSTDLSKFVTYDLAKNATVDGYMDVRAAVNFNALSIESESTSDNAEKALAVLVKQAKRKIKLAHCGLVSEQIGSNLVAVTSYTTCLDFKSLRMQVGETVGLNSEYCKVSGLCRNLNYIFSQDGSATLNIQIVTNTPPSSDSHIITLKPDVSVELPSALNSNDESMYLHTFTATGGGI